VPGNHRQQNNRQADQPWQTNFNLQNPVVGRAVGVAPGVALATPPPPAAWVSKADTVAVRSIKSWAIAGPAVEVTVGSGVTVSVGWTHKPG